ncbi:SNF2 family N-terminal domain-containing protein [Lipomyces arxii]|uniref:SNF2 family N-terminal domain-containing protein n=1 Tax=Lipomyces arxii TaxID=56418 RepID=UPI0034CFB50C
MDLAQSRNLSSAHQDIGDLLNAYPDESPSQQPVTPSSRGAMSISSLLNNEDSVSAIPLSVVQIKAEPVAIASSSVRTPTEKKRRKSARNLSARNTIAGNGSQLSDKDEDFYPSKAAKRRRLASLRVSPQPQATTLAPASASAPKSHLFVNRTVGDRSFDPDETESSSAGSTLESRRTVPTLAVSRGFTRPLSPVSDISSAGDEDENQIALDKAKYFESLHQRLDDIALLATEARNQYRSEYQQHQVKRYDIVSARGKDQAYKFFHDEALALVLAEEAEMEQDRAQDARAQKKRKRASDRSADVVDHDADGTLDDDAAGNLLEGTPDGADASTIKTEPTEDGAATEKMKKKKSRSKDSSSRRKKSTANGEQTGDDLKIEGEEGENVETSAAAPVKRPKKKLKAVAVEGAEEGGEHAGPTIKLTLSKPKKVKKEKAAAKAEKSGDNKNAAPTPREAKIYVKNYNNMYDAIWRDIARKDIPKVARIVSSSVNIKQTNARKTAQLAVKEARRWQFRTNKSVKDLQAKSRRAMREMLVYWKRNEREERDSRRKAEKEALDKAKKEEEQRESRRQARKLNFLITQTELYSHFIGRKIKTDEIEAGSTDDSVATDEKEADIQRRASAAERAAKPAEEVELLKNARSHDISSLDFDGAEDADLHNAAMHNAHSAVLSAQNRAKAFDNKSAMDEDGEMNFQNPTTLGEIEISQPKLLSCTLKGYQLKGLNWLVNLYEQGINGILADEMGLGKTVQSISVMAYLAETHNIWGPFLVIAPASTLHNWEQEISKFVPEFKALPYWGNAKDRKILRKFWDRKQLTYTKDAPFHVLITSYQLIVADAQYFQRIKWQHMILDEAQAIKSSSSSRWKSLLGFQCRNRLLLTGTPIQNSMQELWALLHFIMPTLFDSHDEFSEWFSKDIESHAQSNTQLNEEQLKRLHMILKPFMLRRVKKHVQSELGDKIEIDVYCDLTYRQREMYRALKAQVNLMDIMDQVDSEDTNQNLMNLVMQFRKVCNHPDLFERSDTKSPLSMVRFARTGSFMREGNVVDLYYSTHNFIQFVLPKLIYREGMLDLSGAKTNAGFENRYLGHLLNIWDQDYMYENQTGSQAFSWLKFVGESVGDVAHAFHDDVVSRTVSVQQRASTRNETRPILDDGEKESVPISKLLLINQEPQLTEPLREISRTYVHCERLHKLDPMYDPSAIASPVELICSDTNSVRTQREILFSQKFRSILYRPSVKDEAKLLENHVPVNQYPVNNMLPQSSSERFGYSSIRVPPMSKFVTDSGKLVKLDQLLTELKANDHRVLIYFQMTRMMDLMEEFLTYRQYKYVRLDGSSKLSDRRDLVNDWQTKNELFVFLLSTRAGGLGINLTAADTVIFYDSDWNPTIDSQAMDRAHRLGQTRQVTVYRLLVRGTIEERMRDRAKQKMHVQQVVMEGGSGDSAAPGGVDFQKPNREVAFWLLD